MNVRTAGLLGVALMVSVAGWSQDERLGDVAGSIKLNPNAIVETSGTVDDPRAAAKADEELFNAVLADCMAAADQLGRLVAEARSTVVYPGDEFLTRLEESTRGLDRQVEEIYLIRLGKAFFEPVEMAREAAGLCVEAGVVVRRDIESGSVSFAQSSEGVATCREHLAEAEARFAAVAGSTGAEGGREAAASAAARERATPPTEDEIVDALCEPARAAGVEAFEACQGVQYRAIAALASRSAENEMLAAAVFSDIRQMCIGLHPKDFAARNGCEMEEMTAARLELE